MTVHEFYAYLVRARHDLWSVDIADDVASKPLAGASWRCLKDLILHTAAVEDSWLHEDIARTSPLLAENAELNGVTDDTVCTVPMSTLIAYWQDVEEATLAYLAEASDEELRRTMTPHDDPDRKLIVGDVLWHVMLHEVRHTAQIVAFLRAEGVRPPALDLLFYLPLRS